MYIPRDIQTQIFQALQFFPVLVISGARQAGKTTALREILPDYHYVSLDTSPALLNRLSVTRSLFSPPTHPL